MGTSGSVRGPRVDRATGVTGAGGVWAWVFDRPFKAPPVVVASPVAGSGFYSIRVQSVTTTMATIVATSSAGVTVLGIGVLAAGQPAVGLPLHGVATGPG